MPVNPTYPGVYIEEVPSGVRTITGVATSITAFLGRAKRGPVNEAVSINSFADYERMFGGIDLKSAMSFSVRDFYSNGGSQAIIARLYHGTAEPAKAELGVDNVTLQAAYEGAWGNALRVRVDHDIASEVAAFQGLAVTDLFNLTIRDTATGVNEQFLNVSVKDGSRRLDGVLANDSTLARVNGTLPSTRPDASNEAAPGEDPFGDNTPPTNYQVTTEASDGAVLDANDYIGPGMETDKTGLFVLERTDLFNLLCLPPDWNTATTPGYPAGLVAKAAMYCESRRAMLLLDPPADWISKDKAKSSTLR